MTRLGGRTLDDECRSVVDDRKSTAGNGNRTVLTTARTTGEQRENRREVRTKPAIDAHTGRANVVRMN